MKPLDFLIIGAQTDRDHVALDRKDAGVGLAFQNLPRHIQLVEHLDFEMDALVGGAFDLIDFAVEREAAIVHQGDVAAETGELSEDVGRDDDGPALRAEPLQDVTQLDPRLGVEARCRLV